MTRSDAAFELSLTQKYDDEGLSLIVVETAIPYRRLVFFKKEDSYEARYRMYMEIKDGKGGYISGEVWEEPVRVYSYGETRLNTAVSSLRKVLPIDPGKYRIRMTLEIVDTSLLFYREKEIVIVGGGEGKLVLGEPVFSVPSAGASRHKPSRGGLTLSLCGMADGNDFRMSSDGIFAGFDGWLRVTINIVLPSGGKTGDDHILVSSRIKNASGSPVLYHRERVRTLDKNYAHLCYDINVDDMKIGLYEISTNVEMPSSGQKAGSKAEFIVLLNRGLLEDNFEETLGILSIIADKDELDDLRTSTMDNRHAAWRRFWESGGNFAGGDWKERELSFLRRLKYVLRFFSSYGPGWRTDRGRIYLRNGPPDKVEESQGRQMGESLIYWFYYSKNIVYIFSDSIGSGEYNLLTTQLI